ncbi:MAG: CoA pyrophosphatase [Bacteroidetes bacterium QS_3_64_15]|nr:MAG: CoA pyrophosphatase [Bacteroidetes bacterium QS_3_64_15]
MALLPLSSLTDRLTERLEQPLPGHEVHLTMAPRYPARRADLSVDKRDCREAGVLVLLVPHDGDPAVVLTIRREHLPDHAGQISFPGGQGEGDESLLDAALREAEEEVALPPSSVRMLGRLTPLYTPPSDFCVHPFVGRPESAPELYPTDEEVERVLRVPLAHLLDPATHSTETRRLGGTDVEVPYYDVAGHMVWGATAMMLAELLAVVRDARTPEE